MKNKKITSLILTFALILSLLPSVSASAKAKLSATSKTLTVGKTATIKITVEKSAKWSVSNGKIRIVKSAKTYAKIRAVSKGTSYLKAKVGNKTYKCKVTVVDKKSIDKQEQTTDIKETSTQTPTLTQEQKFDEKSAEHHIKKEIKYINGKIVIFLENNYIFPVSITSDCYFYDKSKNVIDTGFSYCYQLEPNMKGALLFNTPHGGYEEYELKYKFFQSSAYLKNKSIINDIYINHNEVFDDGELTGIYLKIMNQSDYDCSYCDFLVIFYDELGNIVEIKKENFYDIYSKSDEIVEISLPEDYYSYDKIQYSSYDISISTAYY